MQQGRRKAKLRRVITFIVKEIAIRAGFKNPNELAEATGLHYESVRRLWTGTSRRLDLDTLEKLCLTLQVPPGQLFSFDFEFKKTDKQ
ncbi:MAG TPA: helix-turn-helix transcriptional regulator [Blastocatellia bacterium]